MCFEILVPAIISAIGSAAGIGIQSSQAEREADAANEMAREQGAASLLSQEKYNQQMLNQQQRDIAANQYSVTGDLLGGGGENTATTAPTGGGSSMVGYGSTNMDIVPGATQMLQQPNVYTWF